MTSVANACSESKTIHRQDPGIAARAARPARGAARGANHATRAACAARGAAHAARAARAARGAAQAARGAAQWSKKLCLHHVA